MFLPSGVSFGNLLLLCPHSDKGLSEHLILVTRGESVMDPDATWSKLLEAYRESNWSSVLTWAESLLGWLERDGFPPQQIKQLFGVDDAAAKVIAHAFANYAHKRARKEGSHAP